MSDRDQLTQPAGEHERAVQRLYVAVEEQGRARDDRELRAADDEVAARERWLEAVDDHNY